MGYQFLKKSLSFFLLTLVVFNQIHAVGVSMTVNRQTGGVDKICVGQDSLMNWILKSDGSQYPWVTDQYAWGMGHVRIDGEMYSWLRPTHIHFEQISSTVTYQSQHLLIAVTRVPAKDGSVSETFCFTNASNKRMRLTELAIYTPFNDNYPSAALCENLRCNAHVWTGGSDAYVFCTKMGGQEGNLGLILREGKIGKYEIQGRSTSTGGSNFRGVIMLNPDDCILLPGKSYKVTWTLFAADDWNDFRLKALRYGAVIGSANKYTSTVGDVVKITFRSAMPITGTLSLNGKKLSYLSGKEIKFVYQLKQPGEHQFTLNYGRGRTTSVECYAVSGYDSLVKRRCDFIVSHQQFERRNDLRSGALIVYDNELDSQYVNGESGQRRSDCDEARERVGMGILLANQFIRSHDTTLLSALHRYVSFVHRIQRADYTSNSTIDFRAKNRGYNYPWIADFWFSMFQATGDKQYLRDGYGTMRALVRLFGYEFYCINIPVFGYQLLRDNGLKMESDTLLSDMKRLADTFCKNGPNYPKFEVNYEQSIVAPSIIHLLNMYQLTGDGHYLSGAERQLPLLQSFSGEQPSYHLNQIAIRHWDGYWFGKRQTWGDVFPHYWSTLSGIAYRLYAQVTGKSEYDERADIIFRNNLCLFSENGRASCAFVYPFRVNGQKAHFYDPFANDQDWALVYWLRYGRSGTQ